MTTPDKPVPTTKPPSAVRASLISGLVGGLIGAVFSAFVNYAIVGMPDSVAANVVNHGLSGLFSGMTGGFFGLLMHLRKASSTAQANAADQ